MRSSFTLPKTTTFEAVVIITNIMARGVYLIEQFCEKDRANFASILTTQ